MFSSGFLVPFHAECPEDSFLDLNLCFALAYLFHYFFKNIFERNYLFCFGRLISLQIFLYPMLV